MATGGSSCWESACSPSRHCCAAWRPIFLVNVPVGAAVFMAALRYLPADSPRKVRRLDLPGVATLSASLLLVVLPLVLGRSEGWPPWTWACLGASGPAFALFLAAERRITAGEGEPLVNVRVLARPAIYWALLTLLAATGTYYALLFTLAQYLQQGLGDSPLASGLALVPWVAAFGLAGQLVRRLPPRMASRTPGAGCLLLAAAYSAISVMLFTGHHDQALLIALLGIGGLGLGIQFSALIRHLTTTVPPAYAADISGVSTTALQIGAAAGVAAFGTLYLSLTSRAGAAPATHAFAITTAAFAVVALLATATAALATRQDRLADHRRVQACPEGARFMAWLRRRGSSRRVELRSFAHELGTRCAGCALPGFPSCGTGRPVRCRRPALTLRGKLL